MKTSNPFTTLFPLLFACFVLFSSISILACGYDNGSSASYNENGNNNGNGNGNDNGNGHY